MDTLEEHNMAGMDTSGEFLPGVRMVKRTVLVVEDEEDIRELISYTLLKEGYRLKE